MIQSSRHQLRRGAAAALASAVLCSAAAASAQTLVEFNFNEGRGATVTSTAGNLVGTLGVRVNPADAPQVVTDSPSGKPGDTAVKLQGNGFLVVADTPNPIFRIHTNAFTLEAWIKVDPENIRRFEGIVAYGNAYKMGLRDKELLFTLFTIVDIPSGLVVPYDEWHHVAAVWEPGIGVTFYYDGAMVNSVPEKRSILAPANTFLNIGAERLNQPFWGTLDRVRIHKAALTAEELDSVNTSPKAPLASTLAAYSFDQAKPPFPSAVSNDRAAVSYGELQAQNSSPSFSTDTPSGLPGDYSIQFATGQRIVVPDTNTVLALDQADPSFTIQAWLKFNTPAARSVFFYNNAPGGAVSASVFTNRTAFVTTLGIVDQRSNASFPNDGGWHHMAVVHEYPKELRFYIDGKLGDTVPYTRGVIFTRTNLVFYLGSEPTGGLQYVGLLDRFRYSKGALPADQLDAQRLPPGVTPPPALGIARNANSIKLSWPSNPSGLLLQKTLDLASPRTWSNVTDSPASEGANLTLTLPLADRTSFYRLIKP